MKRVLFYTFFTILIAPQFSKAQSLFIPSGVNGIGTTTSDIGIGTSSPSNNQGWGKTLDVRGLANSKILTTNSSSDLKMGIFNHTSWYGGGGFVGTESNHNLFILTGYNVKMSILTNGFVGIATTKPRALFDVGNLSPNTLKTVLARLAEGDDQGDGTYLGVKSYKAIQEQGEPCCNAKSFAIEHNFYGLTNSSINFYRGGSQRGGFITFNTNSNIERMRINTLGNVLIGKVDQKNDNYMLDVAGKVRADEITVNTSGADFVFEKEYNLRPLHEVEAFIKENRHLPDVAPAKTMQENGVSVGEMNAKLLQKIEELTLYLIEKNKRIENLENRLQKLEQKKSK